jgi:hypothetical protein
MSLSYIQTNTLYLAGAGTIVGATSITLTSLTDIYGNVLTMTSFGAKGYITLEPDTTNEEAATFTGITANTNGTYTLTGVSTMIAQKPYTEVSGLIRNHQGGTKVVVTDNVGFWNTFANKNNDETITGTWTFNNFPISPGNPAASATVSGISKLSVNQYAVDTGAANAYVIAPNPAITAYTVGQIFTFIAANTNTAASTVNINNIGAITIKKSATADLIAGDILAGAVIVIEYDGTNFQMIANTQLTPATNIQTFTGGGIFTVTVASPAVFTLANHNFNIGTPIVLSTTGSLPTGLTAGTTYYVIATGFTSSSFQLSTTLGGSAVNTSGSQSGTHRAAFVWFKPAGAKSISVITVGAGGGGASGGDGNGSSQIYGGGGGGGAATYLPFDASLIASTVTVTPGVAGTGGAAGKNPGGNGGGSSFGNKTFAGGGGGGGAGAQFAGGGGSGGIIGSANGETGGLPVVSATNGISGQGISTTSSTDAWNGEWGGGTGAGASQLAGGGGSIYGGGGGGSTGSLGGGGGTTPLNGNPGGASGSYSLGQGAAGGSGNGANGADASSTTRGYGGGGGAGGACGAGSTTGFTGGNGGFPGGGGGAGGFNPNGFSYIGGKGGDGGAGQVTVITYF